MTDVGVTNAANHQPAPGLRERSKAKRRATILRTAMRLFAERGYDNTSVADVAAAAEVAARTVSGYFPSKLDLAVAYGDKLASRLTAIFAANPSADLLDIFDKWLASEAENQDPEMTQLAYAMYKANPEILALTRAHLSEIYLVAGAAMHTHLGLPPDDPMAELGAAAFGAAIETYLLSVLPHTGPSAELHRTVMAYLDSILSSARAS
jgi:AcrR family transcriptional regulator